MRADPRPPLRKEWAYAAYCRAVQTLEEYHGSKVHAIREHVRHLRAEAAGARIKARDAEQEARRLRIELDRLRGGTDE